MGREARIDPPIGVDLNGGGRTAVASRVGILSHLTGLWRRRTVTPRSPSSSPAARARAAATAAPSREAHPPLPAAPGPAPRAPLAIVPAPPPASEHGIPLQYALEEAARTSASRRPAPSAKISIGPITSEGLLASIHAGLDAAETPDLSSIDRAFIRHFRRSLQTSGPRLPPMPEAVVRIDRVLRKPQCTVREVAEVIRADPVVATKIVGIANSPFYAGLGQIRGVEGAITRMGLRETKSIVQAIALGSRLMRVPGHEAEIERQYHHALATAAAARLVAAKVREDADAGFLAGLMHDIGRSVFLAALGDFERANGRRMAPTPGTVEALSDALHEDLSALVAVAWRAGPDIEIAVRSHEAPEHAPRGEGWRLCQVLALADDLARYILDPTLADRPIEQVVRVHLATMLGITNLEPLVEEIEAAAVAFDLPVVHTGVFDPLPEIVSVSVPLTSSRSARPG